MVVNAGDRFGRLEVLSVDIEREQEPKNKKHARRFVMCQCECGNIVSVRVDMLTSKSRPTRSCGCLQREIISTYINEHPPKTKYGDSRERLHNIWYLMNDRCFNEKSPAYKNYGGRGIKVSSEWANGIDGYFRFKQWALENGYASTLTIDRIDNDGNYSPSNCRWISMAEQASNTRRNAYIEWDGRRKTITQWARELGVEMKTLHNRLVRLGWPVERAMTQPYRKSSKSQQHA